MSDSGANIPRQPDDGDTTDYDVTDAAGPQAIDAAAGNLADEVADWRPPWQRHAQSDTPPDEPHDPVTDPPAAPESSAAPSDPPRSDTQPKQQQPVPLLPREELAGTIEAILLVCEEPVGVEMLAQTLGYPPDEVEATIRTLAAEYTGDNRGFDLRYQAGGWRFYTRDVYAPYVERFVVDGQQVRLTKAALETLAVVAYKQPVTRGRISAIRGVNCDGVIRTLSTRGLIEECGTEPDSGAHLYRTTSLFLEKLGINSVVELPELAPFLPEDITEIGEPGDN